MLGIGQVPVFRLVLTTLNSSVSFLSVALRFLAAAALLVGLALAQEADSGSESIDLDALLNDDALLDQLILDEEAPIFTEDVLQSEEEPSLSSGLDSAVKPPPSAVFADESDHDVVDLLESEKLLWDWGSVVAVGGGYKRNALFSAFDTEDSAFTSLEVESTLIRISQPGEWQVFAYLLAENKHYFDVDGLDDEWLAILIAQAEKPMGDHWRLGLAGQYTYLEQAFSLAFEEFDFGSTKIVLHQPEFTPKLEYRFLERAYLKIETPVAMNWFQDSDQNYSELGVDVSLGAKLARGGRVELTYGYEWRDYDERELRDRSGDSLPGESMTWRQHQVELTVDQYLDAAKVWRTKTALRLRRVEDNGAGYYDFWMYKASQRLAFEQGPWTVTAQGFYTHYDYPVQTVSETNLNHRQRSRFAIGLEVERAFGDEWRGTAAYEFEDYLSNVVEDEYDVHVFSIGLSRSF